MKRIYVALALLMVALTPALAYPPTESMAIYEKNLPFTNYSQTIGTTPVQIWPQGAIQFHSFLFNASATGGPNLWCSHQLTATSNPVLAPNAPGAYLLSPGYLEEFPGSDSVLPTNAEWCVATAAGASVTAEGN